MTLSITVYNESSCDMSCYNLVDCYQLCNLYVICRIMILVHSCPRCNMWELQCY